MHETRPGRQVVGASEEAVESCEDMLGCLERGTAARRVAGTCLNAASSRSHAIFTVAVHQPPAPAAADDDGGGGEAAQPRSSSSSSSSSSGGGSGGGFSSKFHFVDLAGSERAKRTQVAPSPPPLATLFCGSGF